jgi:hypothetical protein
MAQEAGCLCPTQGQLGLMAHSPSTWVFLHQTAAHCHSKTQVHLVPCLPVTRISAFEFQYTLPFISTDFKLQLNL